MTTTAYDPRANGKAKRYNKTKIDRLSYYVTEKQNDWYDYVQPLIYPHSAQVHKSACTKPFSLTLSREPLGLGDTVHSS